MKIWFYRNITILLISVGLLTGLMAASFLSKPITGKFYETIIIISMCFLFGLSGFFLMLWHDRQNIFFFKGKLATVYGFLMMIIWWILAIVFLIEAVRKIM